MVHQHEAHTRKLGLKPIISNVRKHRIFSAAVKIEGVGTEGLSQNSLSLLIWRATTTGVWRTRIGIAITATPPNRRLLALA